jgi:hypothetical protein
LIVDDSEELDETSSSGTDPDITELLRGLRCEPGFNPATNQAYFENLRKKRKEAPPKLAVVKPMSSDLEMTLNRDVSNITLQPSLPNIQSD